MLGSEGIGHVKTGIMPGTLVLCADIAQACDQEFLHSGQN
jgi:hypothetical protein